MTEAGFSTRVLSGRIALEVGSREAVAAGTGSNVVLDGEAWLDQRQCTMPILGEPIAGGVYAVALPESFDLPAVRAFVDCSEAAAHRAVP